MKGDKYSFSINEFPNDQKINASPQYSEGRFIGDGTVFKLGIKDYASIIWNILFKKNNQLPDHPLPCKKANLSSHKNHEKNIFDSTWLGHSTLLINVGGYRILTDPVFENRITSTVTSMKVGRFHKELPVNIREISDIDVVIISHDHLDHLNKYSIKVLSHVTNRFLIPLGMGSYLTKWGVNPKKIVELDWWQQYRYSDNLTLIATPARHFSGRGLFTRNKTLWCSWVIDTSEVKLFFSGDSGYFSGFEEIGNTFGPFDLTYMQCGAYYHAWRQIAMNPKEAVKAHLDLKGKTLHPIHWGTFHLSFHSWFDPIRQLTKEANHQQVTIATPVAGETIVPFKNELGSNWWESN